MNKQWHAEMSPNKPENLIFSLTFVTSCQHLDTCSVLSHPCRTFCLVTGSGCNLGDITNFFFNSLEYLASFSPRIIKLLTF